MTFAKSKPIQESEERCRQWVRDTKLHARFNHIVVVDFEHDRAHLQFDNAFAMDDPGNPEYCWVLTEHQGYFVFDKGELRMCIELEEVRRINISNDPIEQ